MSNLRPARADVSLSAYPAFVRRHFGLLIVCIVLGALVGVAAGKQLTAYVGSASVVVPPTSLEPQGLPDESTRRISEKDTLTPDTEAQLVRSTTVLNAVKAATHLSAPVAVLIGRLTIDAPPNTRVLTLSFMARHKSKARIGAQAAAEAYLASRARLVAQRRVVDLAAIDDQITALRSDLSDAAAKRNTGGRTDRLVADIAVTTTADRIRSLERLATGIRATPVDPGRVLRPAAESKVRPRTSRQIPLTSGLLLGLLAGLVVARLRPERITTANDIERSLALEAGRLDIYPLPRPGQVGRDHARRAEGRRSGHPTRTSVAVQRLRNHLVADGAGLTVLTGPMRSGAVAGLAAAVARALSRLGVPVALVADDQDERVLRALRTPASALREVGSNDRSVDVTPDVFAGVMMYRMPRGFDSAERLGQLRRTFGHIIVVAPGDATSHLCAIAQTAERVLVCAERRRTRVEELLASVHQLRLVGARITGSLLVGANRGLAVLGMNR
jgi:capsular polysaccharide biosynthesis protein